MSAPSPNDLFMNVWVSKINSEEFAQPGDREWNQKVMHRFWAKVWLDCKELSQHLQQIEDAVDQTREMMKDESETTQRAVEAEVLEDA